MRKFRTAGAAVALAAAVACAPGGARAADGNWLTALSDPLSDAGYRIAWKSVSLVPAQGRVEARALTATDRSGRVILRIGTVSVDRPRSGPNGSLQADQLVLEKLEAAGSMSTTIGRVAVASPDLRAVARLLAAVAGRPAGEGAGRAVAIERLELTGLRQTWTESDGEKMVATADAVRAEDLRLDPAAFAVDGDPGRLRPLTALVGAQFGLLTAEGVRLHGSRSGTTAIARQWMRNDAEIAGRSGRLRFGTEGMTVRPDDAVAQLIAALFPPDGTMPTEATGDIAYDVAKGIVDYRQQTRVAGFGSLDMRADLRGVPDLTLREWADDGAADPRAADTLVQDLTVALTDSGGIDRLVSTLASPAGKAPTAQRREELATQLKALGPAFNPSGDPRIATWLDALVGFVGGGGTLAVTAPGPIPIGELEIGLPEVERPAAGPSPALAIDTEALARLADRYRLSVTRR